MFFNKSEETNCNNKESLKIIDDLKREIDDLKREKEINDLKLSYAEKENRALLQKKDEKIAELEKDNEAKIQIALKEKNLDLQQERNTYKARCEILEKAFENLGFDVKDMKEILNKLVDGLISKNEINVIR